MMTADFKSVFRQVAVQNDFSFQHNRYWKKSPETVICLELQKSNYSNIYYLNFKIWLQGVFGSKFDPSSELARDTGDVFRGQPKDWDKLFDLDQISDKETCRQEMARFFKAFVTPFTEKALTRSGILELANSNEVFLLPAVRAELDRLGFA
jgi:hypothetical protein